jgi:hypothetical protein
MVPMIAQYLTIESKCRPAFAFQSSMADFTCRPGDMVHAAIVRDSPAISLYCLDDDAQRAIFVELPADVDLTRVPFVYQTQYDLAQRLIAVPYAAFRQLGHTLPVLENLIVIYSVGRSGSTLVSHLLNAVEHVCSLSEPDIATQFVYLRGAPGHTDDDLRDLLDCSVRFLFKQSTSGPLAACALKPRSFGLQVMDLYQATFARGTNLFLYRDAVGVVASYCRLLRRSGRPEHALVGACLEEFGRMFCRDLTHLTAYLAPGATELSLPEQITLMWLSCIESYLAHHARGVRSLAVRYDDLVNRREEVVGAILAYGGLPATLGPEILDVFARDAQAGTALARDIPNRGNQERLTDAEVAAVARILARHPVVRTAGFVVPGTLGL